MELSGKQHFVTDLTIIYKLHTAQYFYVQKLCLSLFSRTSNSDDPLFFELLGQMYTSGESELGITSNEEIANLFYHEATKRGSLIAKYNLAITGMEKNPEQSQRYFFELVNEDNDYRFLGYFGLSLMNLRGNWFEKDFKQAYHYCTIAFKSFKRPE